MSVQPSRAWKMLAERRPSVFLSTYVPKMKDTLARFAAENKEFRDACSAAGVEPTRRQASRYRQRRGRAYACRKKSA